MRPTLVAISHLEIEGRLFHHSAEIIPGLLAKETANKLLDEKRLIECPGRRSLYRLFSKVSGCDETESLDTHEATELVLPP
jgi:hypothetical protein